MLCNTSERGNARQCRRAVVVTTRQWRRCQASRDVTPPYASRDALVIAPSEQERYYAVRVSPNAMTALLSGDNRERNRRTASARCFAPFSAARVVVNEDVSAPRASASRCCSNSACVTFIRAAALRYVVGIRQSRRESCVRCATRVRL